MRPNSGFWSTNTLILSPTHLQSETIKFLVNKPREHHEQRCFPFHKSVFRTSFQSRPLFSAPFRRLRAWPLSREEKQGFDFHDIGQQTTRNREERGATFENGEREKAFSRAPVLAIRSEKILIPFPVFHREKGTRSRVGKEKSLRSLFTISSLSSLFVREKKFFPVPSLLLPL